MGHDVLGRKSILHEKTGVNGLGTEVYGKPHTSRTVSTDPSLGSAVYASTSAFNLEASFSIMTLSRKITGKS